MKEYIFPLVSFVLIFHFQVFAEIKDSAMRAFEEKALEVRPFDLSITGKCL